MVLFMKKFAFIGAGSFIFTRNLVRDLLSFPAFADCELALMDTDPKRLERITGRSQKDQRGHGYARNNHPDAKPRGGAFRCGRRFVYGLQRRDRRLAL